MKNTLMSLVSIVLLATSLAAQNAPIPQQLPLELRKNIEAIQRGVEQPIQPTPKSLQSPRPMQGLLNRFGFRATNKQANVTENRANAEPVEARIAALEAKVEALQNELEAQKALINQLQELLNQQQKKN
jgi:peptidoglycan hydrolase CwlO-like protein